MPDPSKVFFPGLGKGSAVCVRVRVFLFYFIILFYDFMILFYYFLHFIIAFIHSFSFVPSQRWPPVSPHTKRTSRRLGMALGPQPSRRVLARHRAPPRIQWSMLKQSAAAPLPAPPPPARRCTLPAGSEAIKMKQDGHRLRVVEWPGAVLIALLKPFRFWILVPFGSYKSSGAAR